MEMGAPGCELLQIPEKKYWLPLFFFSICIITYELIKTYLPEVKLLKL